MTKPLYLIVACDEQGGIGYRGELPWNIPEDWDFFLESTRNGILIMGRVSYESMRCSDVFPLRDRTYIVVSKTLEPPKEEHVHIVPDVEAALDLSMKLPGRIWGCGGVGIYRELIPSADFLVITQIRETFQTDRYFPENWRSYFPNRLQILERKNESYQYRFSLFSANNPTPGFYNFNELRLFREKFE
jgi:dihydrofolate reductase